MDVDAGIDGICVNARISTRIVLIESDGSEAESLAVGNICKVLKRDVSTNRATRPGSRGIPWGKALNIQGVSSGVLFDVSSLWLLSDTPNGNVGKASSRAAWRKLKRPCTPEG